MKNEIRMACVGAMALGAIAAFAADPLTNDQRVKWLSTVTDGCYNDPANWTDGILPANGIDGRYGYVDFQTQDVTLRAPAGGLVENSGSIFLGAGSGTHTLTIDTRGTFWEKKGLKSINNWWGSPFAQHLAGTHIFNFEGLDSVANDKQVWRFDLFLPARKRHDSHLIPRRRTFPQLHIPQGRKRLSGAYMDAHHQRRGSGREDRASSRT